MIELMIVVALIAIIASVAYPSYKSSVEKSRRADAKTALLGFAQAMERHFTENNSYLGAASGGGNSGSPGIYPSEAPIDSSTKLYDLTIEAGDISETTYTLRATPKNAQADDGYMEITHTGQKRWDIDNSGNISEDENTWER